MLNRENTGKSLPQTVGLDEAFLPLWELEEVGEGWAWWRSHLWQRAVFAASVAALLWALSRVAPGTGAPHPVAECQPWNRLVRT